MPKRLRTWVRRLTPPTTRALARRVAVEVLERVTHGAEQLADSLRPALAAGAAGQTTDTIVVSPPSAPPAPATPLEGADLGWTLARHVSTTFEAQLEAVLTRALDAEHRRAESVRKQRIASRRLRSFVQLFGPWLDKKLRRRILRPLKTITAALGPVRDLDVVVAEYAAAGKHDDAIRRAASEHLRAHLLTGQARIHKRGRKAMRDVDFAALARDLCEARRQVVERLTIERSLSSFLAQRLEATSSEAFSDTPVPTTLEDREAVHDVRILAKRLRYAHAWIKPAFQHGPGAGRLLKRAQRVVGASRDLDLLIARLSTHADELRHEGQDMLAAALETWRDDAATRRSRVDTKILPALSDLSHNAVVRLTRDGLGTNTRAPADQR